MIVDKLGFVGICVCMRVRKFEFANTLPWNMCHIVYIPTLLLLSASSTKVACVRIVLYEGLFICAREGRKTSSYMCVCDIKLINHVVSSSSNTVSEYSERQDKVDVPGRRALVNEVRNNQTDWRQNYFIHVTIGYGNDLYKEVKGSASMNVMIIVNQWCPSILHPQSPLTNRSHFFFLITK